MIYKEGSRFRYTELDPRQLFSLPSWNYSYIFIIDFASGLTHTKKKEGGRKGTTIGEETLRDADRCVGFLRSAEVSSVVIVEEVVRTSLVPTVDG